jgi:Domain of unknown function (DUF4329)
MTDRSGNYGQPKGTRTEAMRIEALAFRLLSDALPRSISKKQECGAVICRDNHSGVLSSTDLRWGDGEVDTGVGESNHSCPPGSTAVAFYHTHPFETVNLGATIIHDRGGASFSKGDMIIANGNQLVAFLGGWDGCFSRYTPPKQPTIVVDGKEYVRGTDDEGNVLPEVFAQPMILNGKLPTRLPPGR